jgi:predicted Zn-dependent peptidase
MVSESANNPAADRLERGYALETLDNGLRLALMHMPHAGTLFLGACLPAGPAYEPKHLSGASHFLEHLHLSVSPCFPERKSLLAAINAIPGEFGAVTHYETIVIGFHTLPSAADNAAELLAECLGIRDYPADIVESERRLILSEISDSPEEVADFFQQILYNFKSLGRPVGGDDSTITELSVAELRQFDESLFAPNRITIVVCGPMDAITSRDIRRHFERLAPTNAESPTRDVELRQSLPLIHPYWHLGKTLALEFAFILRDRADVKANAATRLLSYAFAGSTAGFYEELRYGKANVYHSNTSHYLLGDAQCLRLSAYVKPPERDHVADLFLQQCAKLKDAGNVAQWLPAVKDAIRFNAASETHQPQTIGEFICRSESAREGDFVMRPTDWYDTPLALSADDVAETAQHLFRRENFAAIYSGKYVVGDTRHFKKLVYSLLD